MSTEETKQKGETATSDDFGFGPMGHMMFQMRNMCCTGGAGLPGCSTMGKNAMKPTSNESRDPQKPSTEPEKGNDKSRRSLHS